MLRRSLVLLVAVLPPLLAAQVQTTPHSGHPLKVVDIRWMDDSRLAGQFATGPQLARDTIPAAYSSSGGRATW